MPDFAIIYVAQSYSKRALYLIPSDLVASTVSLVLLLLPYEEQGIYIELQVNTNLSSPLKLIYGLIN